MQTANQRQSYARRKRMSFLAAGLTLFANAFTPRSLRTMDGATFREYFSYFGLRSLPLISLGAVLVSLALTTEVVLEAKRFAAEDVTGAAIAVGLLRELAPLTVGLSWAGRAAAFITDSALGVRLRTADEHSDSGGWLATAYCAAVAAALPLAAYGVVVGIIAAAILAPFLGATSSADFLENARQGVRDKDVVVYFMKLVLINPTVVVFSSVMVNANSSVDDTGVAATAVSTSCIGVFLANLICTWAWYLL